MVGWIAFGFVQIADTSRDDKSLMRRTKPRGTKYAHVLFGEELARRSAMYKFRLGWVVG